MSIGWPLLLYFFILPFNNTFQVVNIIDNNIQVLSTIDIENSNHEAKLIEYSFNGNYAAFLKNSAVIIYKILPDGKTEFIKEIQLDENLEPLCLALYQNQLYIGGRWLGENQKSYYQTLGYYNIEDNKPKWNGIFIPSEYLTAGKAMDAVLIKSNFLYALDNLVYPKYLLKYQLEGKQKIKLEKVIELAANGPNEGIDKAFCNDDYFAFLSTTFGSWDFAYHYNIYKNENFTRCISIAATKSSLQDFIIIEDQLFFIFELYQLACLKLEQNLFRKIEHSFASLSLDLDKKQDRDKLQLKKYDYSLVKLLPLAERTDAFVIIYEKNHNYSYELFLRNF